MGFSLSRALAGAIAGGAGAVSQIADQRIREVARERDDARQLERQRMLMREQDEIMAAREQRVMEAKTKFENDKREKVGAFMKDSIATLKAEGIDPGSVAGQQRLATAAAENGHQDYADKFYDNAIRLGQIKSSEELRKEEMQTRAETSRIAREMANDRKATERDDKEELRRQNELYRLGEVPGLTDRDGKQGKPFDAKPYLVGVYRDAIENGLTPPEAFDAALATRKAIDLGLTKNPDFNTVAAKAVDFASTWRKKEPVPPTSAQTAPAVIQAPPTLAPEKKRIPSIFESRDINYNQVMGK